MSKTKLGAIGCGGFLALLFLCAIVGLLLPTPSEDPDVVSGSNELSSTSRAETGFGSSSEPIPSSTPIPLPTHTPLPSPTATPPVAKLPLVIRSSSGWTFTIDSIDQLPVVESETKRYRPENGVFAVFIGTLGNFSDEDSCLTGNAFAITDANGNEYEINADLLDELKSRYERDYPGFFLGQCIDYDVTDETFLVFDVPQDSLLSLEVEDTSVSIGQLAAYRLVAASETPTPSRVPTQEPTPALNTDPQSTTSPQPATNLQPEDTGALVTHATLNTNANLRSGPGTDHEVVRVGTAGEVYPVYARTFDGWLLLDTVGKTWVASSLAALDGEESQIPIWDGNPIATGDTTTQSNTSAGLGVSREDFYDVFVEPNNLFEFGPAADLFNGQPRVIGEMVGTKAVIELIGPPNNLYKATLLTIAATTPGDVVEVAVVTMAFLRTAVPSWDGVDDWFQSSVDQVIETGEPVTTIHEDRILKLEFLEELGIMLLSVSAEGYEE